MNYFPSQAMKVLKRKAGKMKQRDPSQRHHNHHHHQVGTQPVSWNLPESDTEMEKEDQKLTGNSGRDEDQGPETESLKRQQTECKEPAGGSRMPHLQDLKHLQTDPTTLILEDQVKQSLNDMEKGHLHTDPTARLLGDQINDPLTDSDNVSLVRETQSVSPTSTTTNPEAALQGGQEKQEPGGDPKPQGTLMRGNTKRPQWEAKNGGAWCELVDDRQGQLQGWWREGGILLVSWVCVLLTATEFIIKRVS